MGLNSEKQIFLTQDDQGDHDINQFQTKFGESFDFREGYDAVVYEVHKQYKLRSRTIDVPKPIKSKDTKQPKKIKEKAVLTEPSNRTDPNPKEVTVEDIAEIQPFKNKPFSFPSSKENSHSAPENISKKKKPITTLKIKKRTLKMQLKSKNLLVTTLRLNWRNHSI